MATTWIDTQICCCVIVVFRSKFSYTVSTYMLELYNDRLLDLYIETKKEISSHLMCQLIICSTSSRTLFCIVCDTSVSLKNINFLD